MPSGLLTASPVMNAVPSSAPNCSPNSSAKNAWRSNSTSSRSCRETLASAYISCVGTFSIPTLGLVVSARVPISDTQAAEALAVFLGIWIDRRLVVRTLATLRIGEYRTSNLMSSLTNSAGARYPPVVASPTVIAFFSISSSGRPNRDFRRPEKNAFVSDLGSSPLISGRGALSSATARLISSNRSLNFRSYSSRSGFPILPFINSSFLA
ncbi:MAG: hypothetical protein BWY96_03073 [Spirochaetes bacterium ADurb.BinA120]|nr:MAG: hypothetical protein BWY96_03073 [Spirochaetes bacterium ADurb.BinA120]